MGSTLRRMTAAFVTLFVLSATMGGTPAHAAAKKRSLSMAPSASQPLAGTAVSFNGFLTRSPSNTKVYLERKSGTKWVRVATVRTTKSGSFRYVWRASGTGLQTWRAHAPKTSKLKTAYSKTRVIGVYRPAVATLDVSPTTVSSGQTATLSGTVAPFAAGTAVTLQRLDGSTWVTDGASSTVSTSGGFQFVRTPGTSASYRALVARTNTFIAPAMSPSVAVTVSTPPPASTSPTRVHVTSDGSEAQGQVSDVAISSDGRYVAFSSDAPNLVAEDSNGTTDVFLHDRTTKTTTLISKTASGAAGNGVSSGVSISGDGNRIAFDSSATDLVTNDTNDTMDVFVYDRTSDQMTLVSRKGSEAADSYSYVPHISEDGSCVAYVSHASNLAGNDNNEKSDVFVTKLSTMSTTLLSTTNSGASGNEESHSPSVSANCALTSFTSEASNLISGDSNYVSDVFVRNIATNSTTLVSRSSGGQLGDDHSAGVSKLSANGKFVAYPSSASNLVAGDTNGTTDVFVTTLATGATKRVSVNSAGVQADSFSMSPSISSNGRFVGFQSYASNLAPVGDIRFEDTYLHDTTTGQTVPVDVDSNGFAGDSSSTSATVSSDGAFVVFLSSSTNLIADDSNYTIDAFVAAVSDLF